MFAKAVKSKSKLRLALIGPSGSGKTYSALAIASSLADKVALLDTERGSASKYADLFTFDVAELTSFEPERYVAAIEQAAYAGYGAMVIDSLSHAWVGKGGILEFVDNKAKASNSGSSFGVWRDATPKHNALVDAILGAPLHVLVTMRAKMDYVQERDDRGKTVIRKVGLQPVQRDGLEYEFDVIAEMTADHQMIVSKSRYSGLSGRVIDKPGAEVGSELRQWLEDGIEATTSKKLGPVDHINAILTEAQALGLSKAAEKLLQDYDYLVNLEEARKAYKALKKLVDETSQAEAEYSASERVGMAG
jgi:hypothetical protein